MRGLVAAILAVVVLFAAGCTLVPIQPGTPVEVTPLAQAEDNYLTVHRAIEGTQRDLELARGAGLLDDAEWRMSERLNTTAKKTMAAWKAALIEAYDHGGALPANHPAVVEAVNRALSELNLLLAEIIVRLRARLPTSQPAPG